jgi:GR25 family glycosyltransferase involved in LPS biosynthesis
MASIPTYVINLREREDRLEHIYNQFSNRPEFNLTIVEAIKKKIGALDL